MRTLLTLFFIFSSSSLCYSTPSVPSSLVGTWILGRTTLLVIDTNGVFYDATSKDTLGTATSISRDSIVLANKDDEIHFSYTVNGTRLHLVSDGDTAVMIRKPPRDINAKTLSRKLAGEWKVHHFLGFGLGIDTTGNKSVNYVFDPDTVWVYVNRELVSYYPYIPVTNGLVNISDPRRADTGHVVFEQDSLILPGLAVLTKLDQQTQKVPHQKVYRESVPSLSLHHTFSDSSAKVFLDSLLGGTSLSDTLFTLSRYALTVGVGDSQTVADAARNVAESSGKRYRLLFGERVRQRGESRIPTYIVEYPALISGKKIESVHVSRNLSPLSEGREAVFHFQLNRKATKAFAEYTGGHLNQYVAIVVNGKVASRPVIRARIDSGVFELTYAHGPDHRWTDAWEVFKKAHHIND